MNDRARAILDEARETLERLADIKVDRRDQSADYWSQPKPAPAHLRQPSQATVAEIEMQRSQDWTQFVDSRIEQANAARDDYWRDVDIRKQLRAELAKVDRPAEELFYIEENGVKHDRELHAAIINPVDYPIDEKIMGPMRARHRAKWLAGQKDKRAARIIDLPSAVAEFSPCLTIPRLKRWRSISCNGRPLPGLETTPHRRKYLKALHDLHSRNVIIYYSGWLRPYSAYTWWQYGRHGTACRIPAQNVPGRYEGLRAADCDVCRYDDRVCM